MSRTYYPAANSGGVFHTETMTSSATPTVAGGVPTGAETLDESNIQSLTRNFTNAAGQVLWSDSYASMSGVTFYEAVGLSSGAPPTREPTAQIFIARSTRTTTKAVRARRSSQRERSIAPTMTALGR